MDSSNKLATQMEQLEKALLRFKEALDQPENDFLRDSSIQRFEFTFDLLWKTLKTLLKNYHGVVVQSPNDTFREAFQQGILQEEDKVFIGYTHMRNMTSHTYIEDLAKSVYKKLPGVLGSFTRVLKTIQEYDK